MTIIKHNGWTLHYTIGSVVAAPVKVGDEVLDFRGDKLIVRGGTSPHKVGSAGYVDVTEPGNAHVGRYYATVIGAKWINDETGGHGA